MHFPFLKNQLSLLFLTNMIIAASAQDEGLRYENYVYKDNIRSVLLHAPEVFFAQPIVELGRASQLELSFDDLDGDVKNYTYTIIHCDMNWNPSDLAPIEYIDGYNEDRVEHYSFSFSSLQSYTHYELLLPNDNISWIKSGNYLLKVYEDDGEKTLALTRRFMVEDPKVRIQAKVTRPAEVDKIKTHQEIDFAVNVETFPIKNPQREIRAVVLQNGRWDNAIMDLPPFLVRLGSLDFNYQDQVVFPGGKEFRSLDLRSVRHRRKQMAKIEKLEDRHEVYLDTDHKFSEKVYLHSVDINGKYLIESYDIIQPESVNKNDSQKRLNNRRNVNDLAADYPYVHFSLSAPEPYDDQDVYLVGAFTDWQLMPDYKMTFDIASNNYMLRTPLKQGYYNYAYTIMPHERPYDTYVPVDLSETEGDWHETENEYTILIYYRPFGNRYDELIGSVSFSSTQ